jgi:hypothetical protein
MSSFAFVILHAGLSLAELASSSHLRVGPSSGFGQDVPPQDGVVEVDAASPAESKEAVASEGEIIDLDQPPAPGSVDALPNGGFEIQGAFIGVAVGLAGGGDPLIEAVYTSGGVRTVDAGDSAWVGMVSMFTPWWTLKHRLGFGIGLHVCIASAGVSGDTTGLTFFRAPVSIPVHVLAPLADHWALAAAFGPYAELAGAVKGTGAASGINEEFEPALGTMLQVVLYYEGRRWATQFGVRATFLEHTPRLAAGQHFDANSIGVVFGVGVMPTGREQ